MATTPPSSWSSYWPSGVTASQLSSINKSAANFPFLDVGSASSYKSFLRDVQNNPDSLAGKTAAAFGGPEKYKAAADAYNLANLKYTAEVSPGGGTQQRYEKAVNDYVESSQIPAQPVEQPKPFGTITSPKFGDLNFLDEAGNVPDPLKIHSYKGQTTGLRLNVDGKTFTFIPQNILENGWVKDGKQHFFGNVLLDDNIQQLAEKGELVNLAGLEGYEKIAQKNGISTTGYLVPITDKRFTEKITEQNIRFYDPEEEKNNGQIQGLRFINEKPVYLTAPKGSFNNYQVTQSWIQPPGTVDYTGQSPDTEGEFWVNYYIPPKKKGGLLGFVNDIVSSDLFKIGSLALGAYGLYNLATAPAAAPGAAGAAGTGLTPGAAGVTGLTSGAAGVTGLTVPAGFTLAPGVGATVGGLAGATDGFGLLDTTDFSRIGETGLIPGSSGEGIQVVTPPGGGAATIPGLEAPSLSAMGGAQGITVPIQGGGVVSEMGFVPPGATPSLGDPASFINNPDYLGSPVISEDYLALTGADMPGGISTKDALDLARRGAQLLSPQQQMMQQGGLLGGGGVNQPMGVDFSPLYGRTMVGLLPLAEEYRRSLL